VVEPAPRYVARTATRQALQNDRDFRRLPPDRQQKFEQRLQRFDNMPPERQQQVLVRRMETWGSI
jgi:hypothetical protein